MTIATSGYVAITVDFSRLIPPGRQAEPSADRARFLEVVRILNGGRERGCGDRADAGDRHEDLTCSALARGSNKLAPEFSSPYAHAAPSFQHRQHDRSEPVPIDEETADILLERASLARGHQQSERLHDAADLILRVRW